MTSKIHRWIVKAVQKDDKEHSINIAVVMTERYRQKIIYDSIHTHFSSTLKLFRYSKSKCSGLGSSSSPLKCCQTYVYRFTFATTTRYLFTRLRISSEHLAGNDWWKILCIIIIVRWKREVFSLSSVNFSPVKFLFRKTSDVLWFIYL